MKKLTVLLFFISLFVGIRAQDTIYVYQENGMIRIDNFETTPLFMTPGQISYKLIRDVFVFKDGLTNQEYSIGTYTEIYNVDTNGFDTQNDCIDYLNTILNRRVSDVAVQDQTTPPIEYFLTREINDVVITNQPTAQSNRIELQSGHGVQVDEFIEIYNEDSLTPNLTLKRFAQLRVIIVSADTVWVGQYIGFDIDSESVQFSKRTTGNMAVDASLDTVVRFSIGPPNGIKWDLTRTILGMVLNSQPDDSEFGDIVGGLDNGIFFGFEGDIAVEYLVNIKINAGFRGTAYDVSYQARSVPAGSYGLSMRKSFSGQDKYGVAIRLDGQNNDEFVIYIQDDLTDLIEFGIKVMGHIVED